ncbi:lactonase family protein [Virgibacillus halodenitrificans]|uniref:lactonase family protein n=1 Tax=Virgibacillus halodenitrificans TaxID=1482 RepID=UPI0024BF14CB|nr:lactonase family protein [Virgibacillus halodenitrificans]WHX26575.1 lactonase family protein [Virgibacillus halodenitrificans]
MGKTVFGYAGTYTRKTSEGIYRFSLDTETGELREVELAANVGSPTYLTIDPEENRLYSVAQDNEMGGVRGYVINRETGNLNEINGQLVEGAPPCHVDFGKDGLVTGNYHKGTVGLHAVNEAGELEQGVFRKHEGSGPHDRQEKPHVHFTGYTPEGNYIVVADLGTDELVTYQSSEEGLEHVSTLKVNPGSGPRHLTFHPDGKHAFLLTELSSEVLVLDYDSTTGTFSVKQSIKAIPGDFKGTNDASAIHVTTDGQFLYTGNRGHNSVAVFQIDPKTKELSLIEIVPSEGEWPRDFVLSPCENYLVVSNQHSGNIVLFKRDIQTGRLEKTNSQIDVPEVVCVKFLA